MKVLALETATIAGSVAIVDSGKGLVGEIRVDVRIAHAERLMSSVEWLLKSSRVLIDDIDAFAVSIGPGSFTGLRIGLSTAKGFAYSTGKPVIPVPTLDAFARTLPFCALYICPMLDARKNEIYTGLYKWDGSVCKKIILETAVNPQDFLKKIKEPDCRLAGLSVSQACPTVFIGEGAVIYKKLIQDTLQDNAVFAPAARMSPSASSVAEIAIERSNEGAFPDPVSLTPFYIRKSEAEIRWK
ncbi:MAG TPA: tRNA (adenosine(37)-N6)-threonylcarbamoyltransferase complex dimerization subunit type 1 TsaB [Nitrospirae bacterium]|nr:tRNA (adenosine(37)-N6)-threonylcarbamoyltransferase complex dimerization subunit type 1 TsaB [Nitrospirota bacterium]